MISRYLYSLNFFNFLFGFLLFTTVVSSIIGENINYYFRIYSTLLSIIVIIDYFLIKKCKLNLNSSIIIYFIFVLAYLLRIIVDLEIKKIALFNHDFTSSELIYSTITYLLITPISLATIQSINYKKIIDYGYIIISGLLLYILLANIGTTTFTNQRINANEFIGISLWASYAAVITVWSFIKFIESKRNNSRMLHLICFIISILNVFLSGTRSVFFAMGLVILLKLFFSHRSKYQYILVFAFLSVIIFNYSFIFEQATNTIFGRIEYGLEYGRTGREFIYAKVLSLILQYPLFGYSFIVPGFAYAHNFILDAFMSLGIAGGILFVIINIRSVKFALLALKNNNHDQYLGTCFLIYLVYGMFSLNLYSAFIFWGYLFITFVLKNNYNQALKSHIYEYNN